MSSNLLFWRTNSPKHKDIQYPQNKEKKKLLMLKKLQPENDWHFCLKNKAN